MRISRKVGNPTAAVILLDLSVFTLGDGEFQPGVAHRFSRPNGRVTRPDFRGSMARALAGRVLPSFNVTPFCKRGTGGRIDLTLDLHPVRLPLFDFWGGRCVAVGCRQP